MHQYKTHRTGGALILVFATLLGCNEIDDLQGDEKSGAPSAQQPIFTADDDPLHILEMAGVMGKPTTGPANPPPPPATDAVQTDLPPPPPPPKPRLSHCGAEPEVTSVDVCGRALPEKFHLAWSDCVEEERGPGGPREHNGHRGTEMDEGPDPRGAPATTVTTRGNIDVLSSYDLSDVDSCDPDVELTVKRDSRFSFGKTGDRGSMQLDGTVFASATFPLGTSDHTLQASLNTTRIVQPRGKEEQTLHESGDITVAFARGVSSPTRTVNGRIDIERNDGKTGFLTVTDVVHVSPRECRWPISGTMAKTTPDGASHSIVFGPACGQAMVDGAEVDLSKGPARPEGEPERPPRDGKRPPRDR